MAPVLAATVGSLLLGAVRGLLTSRDSADGALGRNCATGTWPGHDELDEIRRLLIQSDWLDAPWTEADTAPTTPKPAFLLMIYERVVFPEAWEAFLDQAAANSFSVVIHAKSDNPVVPASMKRYIMNRTVPTARCHDVNLMLTMMGEALKDKDVTHVVTVSGDTLPLRPLSLINAELGNRPNSRFCVDPEYQRAETWFVLQRVHAEFLSSRVEELGRLIPRPSTHEPCDDEEWFFWPLMIRGSRLVDQCVMMTDWTRSPKYWRRDSLRCGCPSFLFGSTKVEGSCARPSMFLDVGARGLDEVMQSRAGYWFLRKFPGDGIEGSATFNGSKPLDAEVAMRLRAYPHSQVGDSSTTSSKDELSDLVDAVLKQPILFKEFNHYSHAFQSGTDTANVRGITPALDSFPATLGL